MTPANEDSVPAVALSIAGSDPSGGAGIQADLKVFHHHQVFGTAVIAAMTVQNTTGVLRATPVAAELVAAQLEAVLDDLPVAAVKTGALGSAGTVRALAQRWRTDHAPPLILDPVLESSSGHPLLDPDALRLLRDELLPRCTLITPNLREAELLCGFAVQDAPGMERAGRALLELGAGAALIKGGHLDGNPIDVLVSPERSLRFRGERVLGPMGHGTGCALSAAICARLAQAESLEGAVAAAIGFVREALRSAPKLGRGCGPLNLWADRGQAPHERAQ